MESWWPIAMLALAGFFLGGTISFIKSKTWVFAIGCGVATVLCLVASIVWWGAK